MRGLQVGLTSSIKVAEQTGCPQMRLVLEPEVGGDHRLELGATQIVEQVKIRNASRRWSLPEFARDILPDLVEAFRPGLDQKFRFVTDNAAGLAPLRRYLQLRRLPKDVATRLRWRQKPVTLDQFEAELASEAGMSEDECGLRAVLANLSVEIIDLGEAEREVDAVIRQLLAPGECVRSKREQLTTRLLGAARDGATLPAEDLLAAICENAGRRLALANSLRRDLPQKVLQVAISLDYRPEHEARISPPPDFAPVTLLSGESGQGKTWVLCRAAIAEAASGRLALLTRAPQSCRDLVEFISRSIWEDAYGDPGTIAQMKQRVGPHFADDADFWLTLYVDDIQDPSFARELKQRDLASDGIRLVISCQPRIADILAGGPNARDIPVGDFTSADLRRFLASHQRDQALETMPDDVFELLLKPIHAAIFARLPPRQSWVGHTEYELFGSYWTHAVKVARDQRDHRSDAVKLLSLARLVTSDPPAYPIDNRRRLAAGVDDDVLLRLEQVGFVQWRTTDSVAFTSDRMLNWAVAEATVACIVDERLPPEVADLTLA
jgi:hypothetical protein